MRNHVVLHAAQPKRLFSRTLLLIFLALPFAGCPIPIPVNETLHGTRMKDAYLTFLHPGLPEATVVARLGQPSIIWDEAHLYIYDWQVRDWLILFVFGYGYTAGAVPVPVDSDHALFIQFDDQNQVARFEKVTRPPLTSYGDFLREWVNRPPPATRPARAELVTD